LQTFKDTIAENEDIITYLKQNLSTNKFFELSGIDGKDYKSMLKSGNRIYNQYNNYKESQSENPINLHIKLIGRYTEMALDAHDKLKQLKREVEQSRQH
jgi:hypothetical protein